MNVRAMLLCFALICIGAKAQTTSEIYHDIQKLNSFDRVLYVAAHPDDENTRAIAWLSKGAMAQTAYLSLTRGDGGQNLIGSEMGPLLGVLRTQELLAARRIDGGQQFFSRAVDFGYSKTSDETLDKWNKDLILHDVVSVIRYFKPDVIITRFPPDKRGGHGHHTASAMLALEAFEKAADPNYKTEAGYAIWQAKSVYWNSSVWWYKDLDSLARNNEDYIIQDIGGFNHLLGVSYNELGSLARSQHKCQGFGVSIDRGERLEYFKWMAGEKLNTITGDQNRSWQNLGLGSTFLELSKKVEAEFDFTHPENSLDDLFEILKMLEDEHLPKDLIIDEKIELLKKIILECSGIYLEATTTDFSFATKEDIEVKIRMLNKNGSPFSYSILADDNGNRELPNNKYETIEIIMSLPDYFSNAYWLSNNFSTTYQLSDIKNLEVPENGPLLSTPIRLMYKNYASIWNVPVCYQWSDRVKGEIERPIVTAPIASAEVMNRSLVFTESSSKKVNVLLKNFRDGQDMDVVLQLPKGWVANPKSITVGFDNKYEEKIVSFEVTAPAKSSMGQLKVLLNNEPAKTIHEVAYDHIPTQLIYLPTQSGIISLDIDFEPGHVAYIEGAGDDVAEAIEQIGYSVDILSKEDLATVDLMKYKAVFTGIRAYNTNPWLFDYHDKFMAYVKEGGNFIVQYNTRSRSKSFDVSKIGPYPFSISRSRVAEEDAKVSFVDPRHGLLNEPNKIGKKDFDNWVQERGLYFANDLDQNYQTLFSWHDTDEAPQLGGLIQADYGTGSFIYTGISFFRQLPAGVPGAYKLLANMISYEQE